MTARRLSNALLGLVLLSLFAAPPASAIVSRLTVESRQDVLGGRPFGTAGPYERLVGVVEFALDPANTANAAIVDLTSAPRDASGRVTASANFVVLRPKTIPRDRSVGLLEVSNRGGKAMLPYFARAAWSTNLTTEAEPGKPYLGIDRPKTTMSWRQGATHIGELQAWDMTTGQKVWTHKFPYQNWGPILTTGGGLVFMGGTNDRNFWAFDANTGAELWKFKTNSGITGVPSSYAIDGVQDVAVQSGWGVDAQRMQARLDTFRNTKTDVPQGGVIWVFGLRD